MSRWRRSCGLLALAAGLGWAAGAQGGSTEPDLALATVTATVNEGVVTLELGGSFDFRNLARLGYPLTVVLTEGTTSAVLALDGTVTVRTADGELPAAGPGVIALAPDRMRVVVPSRLAGGGVATVRLEALFQGQRLRSNAVEVRW
jgi:hypothetical protein